MIIKELLLLLLKFGKWANIYDSSSVNPSNFHLSNADSSYTYLSNTVLTDTLFPEQGINLVKQVDFSPLKYRATAASRSLERSPPAL